MMSNRLGLCFNSPRLCPSSWIATRRRQAATWASLNAPALTLSVTCSTRADESRNTTDGLELDSVAVVENVDSGVEVALVDPRAPAARSKAAPVAAGQRASR